MDRRIDVLNYGIFVESYQMQYALSKRILPYVQVQYLQLHRKVTLIQCISYYLLLFPSVLIFVCCLFSHYFHNITII